MKGSANRTVVHHLRELSSEGELRADALERECTDCQGRLAAAQAGEAKTRALLDAVMEQVPAFIMAIDPDGVIRFINKVLPHHSIDQVIGSFWLDYVAPDEHEVLRARFARVLETGTPERYQVSVRAPDGQPIWFWAQLSPMPGFGVMLTTRDVTELKTQQLDHEASRRMSAMTTLAGGVAHEINTPVQFVGDSFAFLREVGRDLLALAEAAQVLRRRVEAGASAEDLEEATARLRAAEEDADLDYVKGQMAPAFDRAAQGLSSIGATVQSLKEMASPRHDRMQALDLNLLVREAAGEAAALAGESVRVDVQLGTLPPVTCYADDVRKVLSAVLTNAAHAVRTAAQPDSKITLSTRLDGADAVISVSDTGAGVPDDIRDRIFEPFFTPRAVGEGTGQGLATAWVLVTQRHSGHLSFVTTPGVGTTFHIRLPVAGVRSD